MTPFPPTSRSLLIRTDFQDQPIWEATRDRVLASEYADFEVLDDVAYAALTPIAFLPLITAYEGRVLVLFDGTSREHPEQPLLIIDLLARVGDEIDETAQLRSAKLRATPVNVLEIESNLSLANMDYTDYTDACAEDGIFRGF